MRFVTNIQSAVSHTAGVALLAILILSAAAAAAEIPDTAKVHFNAGVEAMQADKIDAALKEFEAAVALAPDYLDAHINAGALYFEKGDLARASEHLKASLDLDTANAGAWFTLGQVEAKQEKYKASISALTTSLKFAPKDVDTRMFLAATYKDAGQDAKAIAEYQEVVKLDPDNYIAFYNMGNIYQDQKKFQQAIKAYRESTKHNPSHLNSLYNLAICVQTVAQTEDDYRDAMEAYQAFIEKAKGKKRWASYVGQARDIVKQIQDYLDQLGG